MKRFQYSRSNWPAVPYDAIAIYVRSGDELVPEYVNGDNFRLFSSLRIPIGQGLSGWVAQNNKPIINGNPSVEPGYLNDTSKYSTLNARFRGSVGGSYKASWEWSLSTMRREILYLRPPAHSAGGEFQDGAGHRERDEVRASGKFGHTDYLTGLPNARSLFLQLDRELARCKRDQNPDRHGLRPRWLQADQRPLRHLEGNRVLRLFAHSLKETSREYDYVARMGGDEFVIIAPGLTPEAAARKAEQMRDLAQQAGKAVCNEDILSLSVGKAVYPEDGMDAEKILSEADKRMYLQKRNQSSPKNRRLYPRVRGRLTTEISGSGLQGALLGIVTNLSLGGCYVETRGLLLPGSKLKLTFRTNTPLLRWTAKSYVSIWALGLHEVQRARHTKPAPSCSASWSSYPAPKR